MIFIIPAKIGNNLHMQQKYKNRIITSLLLA